MKTKRVVCLWVLVLAFVLSPAVLTAVAPEAGVPAKILVYKGDKPDTGPGVGVIKMTVGEEVTLTAKGVDEEGNEVAIWPTWKADRELSVRVVEGRSKTVIVKAVTDGTSFLTAIYITDDGKKVTGEVAFDIKAK